MINKPKILIFDIETTPLEAFAWGPKWETNLIEVTEQSRILSYSARWLNGKHITKGWPHYKGYKKGSKDDKSIVKDIWNLFDEADIIVTQNGKSFDIKVMNTRFLFHGLTPPSPAKIVDTKTEAKKYLRMPSYGLDDMCDYFGLGRKQEHEGFPLWKKCMAGDNAAWNRMLKYNKNDVLLTEKIYRLLLPFMVNHPNISVFNGQETCPKCGSSKLQSRGYAVTITQRYKRGQCLDCGGWFRYTISERGPRIMVRSM